MDWRTWMYGFLNNLLESDVNGDGSLNSVPEARPFIIVRLDQAVPEFEGTSDQDVTLWVHDDPGSYLRIDNIIANIRQALDRQPVTEAGGITAVWQGDSGDLADDDKGTIVRTSSYRMVGRSA
jgi:hypothetical protein